MTTKRRRSSRAKAAAAAAKPSESAPASKPKAKPKSKSRAKQYTRPGVAAAARLASLHPLSDHVDKWERAASRYAAMIKSKGGAKLSKLDKQRESIASGWTATSGMSKEQLLDVMIEWKFAKGKPRHALKPLLKSNSEASVATASKRAFETADGIPNGASGECSKEISTAINQLCELKGVGPATASAVLCAYRPDIFAFMDDELIECLYDGKRGYTLKIYAEVNDRCREIAAELNECDEEWTPCRVGKALWTVATMSATNDEDGLSAVFEDGGGKSKSPGRSRKRAKKS